MESIFAFLHNWRIEFLLGGIFVSWTTIGIILAVKFTRVATLFRHAGERMMVIAENDARKEHHAKSTGDPRKDRLRALRDERIKQEVG